MSDFGLGENKPITPYTAEQIDKADVKLNRYLIDAGYYALKGLGYGLVASIFFSKRVRVMWYFTGFGFGYATYLNCHPLVNNLKNSWYEVRPE